MRRLNLYRIDAIVCASFMRLLGHPWAVSDGCTGLIFFLLSWCLLFLTSSLLTQMIWCVCCILSLRLTLLLVQFGALLMPGTIATCNSEGKTRKTKNTRKTRSKRARFHSLSNVLVALVVFLFLLPVLLISRVLLHFLRLLFSRH